ncbi:MAG: hypothetical protein ACK5RL_10735 [Acidimicrobiales bacterium]
MTVLDAAFEPGVAGNGVRLLPERPPRLGPVSRRLIARTVALLLAQVAIGTVLVVVGGDAGRTLGLGLVFPGAGWLYSAAPVGFALTVILTLVAVVLWWGISAHFAIPLVWWASAILAAATAEGPRLMTAGGTIWPWVVPLTYVAFAVAAGLVTAHYERAYRSRVAKVPELNAYLASAVPPDPVSGPLPLTEVDRELVRWTFDLALQPLDTFDGFDWGEQIHGPTCVRYQLDFLTWALSLHAVNHVPNAPATAERAMAALIDRQTDIRVWGYWRTLNRIGNYRNDPDPIAYDNIMFSAYLLDVINAYENATGSDRFDADDALVFVWKDGRTFSYNHHRLAEAVHRNLSRSRLGLFPCEPGWVFTACNTFAAQGLAGHDRRHHSGLWDDVHDHWRRGLEQEMLTPDGNFQHIRSKVTGLSFDTGEVPDGAYYTTGTNGFADVAPDMAVRARLLALRGAEEKMNALAGLVVDGVLDLTLEPAAERNTGIRTAVPEWTRLIGGALGTGRADLAAAAKAGADRQCATEGRWPDRPLTSGVQNTGVHLFVRWGAPLSTADLALRGYVAPTGPVLRSDLWPAVLVTEAISPDGGRLELTVEPGSGPTTAAFVFDQLEPGADYTVTSEPARVGQAGGPDTQSPDTTHGVGLTADDGGHGSVELHVPGIRRITVAPNP